MTRNNKIVALAVACGIFFVAGIIVAGFGPALPDLAANTGSSLAAAGSLITALFLGALVSQIFIGPIQDRFGVRPVLMTGLLVTALGVAAATLSTGLAPAWGFMLFAGLGDGVLVVGVNVMVAVVFASRSVMALNLSNVFYGIGAVAGPAIAGFATAQWGTAIPVLWVAAGAFALLALAMPLLRVPRSTGIPTRGESEQMGEAARPVYRSPALWALGGLLLVYVGVEIGVGSWAITYLGRAASVSVEQAALAASGYWLALTAGRLAGAGVGVRLGSRGLLTLALSGAFAGSLMLLLSAGSAALMVGGLLLIGASFGPVYPTVVALTTAIFPYGPARAGAAVMAMGSVGGMVLPWLLGATLEWGGPYASISVASAGALAMLALHATPRLARARTRRAGARAAARLAESKSE
jgi:fucose permease